MATFMIPGEIISKARVLGGGAPDTGYYKAQIESVQAHPTKATSRRVNLVFETGFATMYWLHSPFDAQGNQLPGLSERQVGGMIAAIKTMFVSAGYTSEQMTNGVTDDWLIGKTVHLEWHSGKDRGAQYGEIERIISQARFDDHIASGKKPACAGAGDNASASGANATAAPVMPAAPVATAAVAPTPVATVAPAPNSGGITLPPPPGGARQLSH